MIYEANPAQVTLVSTGTTSLHFQLRCLPAIKVKLRLKGMNDRQLILFLTCGANVTKDFVAVKAGLSEERSIFWNKDLFDGLEKARRGCQSY